MGKTYRREPGYNKPHRRRSDPPQPDDTNLSRTTERLMNAASTPEDVPFVESSNVHQFPKQSVSQPRADEPDPEGEEIMTNKTTPDADNTNTNTNTNANTNTNSSKKSTEEQSEIAALMKAAMQEAAARVASVQEAAAKMSAKDFRHEVKCVKASTMYWVAAASAVTSAVLATAGTSYWKNRQAKRANNEHQLMHDMQPEMREALQNTQSAAGNLHESAMNLREMSHIGRS